MLEIGACMELKAKSSELEDNADTRFTDISFEELLAKEKKDSFWLVSHLKFLVSVAFQLKFSFVLLISV